MPQQVKGPKTSLKTLLWYQDSHGRGRELTAIVHPRVYYGMALYPQTKPQKQPLKGHKML